MFITKWDAKNLFKIFESGICVKDCPDSKKYIFKEGKNCKTPKGLTKGCEKLTNMYSTVNVADYCLPESPNDMDANSKKGY